MRLVVLSVLSSVLLHGTAHSADAPPPSPPSDEQRAKAKEHFDGGTRFYRLGQFARAAEEYTAAYALVRDSVLLFDAAQAYRLDRDWVHALKYYRDYLATTKDAEAKSNAATHIKDVEAAMAAQAKAPKKTGAPAAPPEGASNRAPAIAEVIKKNRDGFRACFDTWSKTHIGIDASFVLVLWVEGDGKVAESAAAALGVEAPDAEVCIAAHARKLAMPTSQEGYQTRFTYPFNFKAH